MNKNAYKYVLKILLLFLLISFITDKITYIVLNKISDRVYSGQSIGKLNHYLQVKDSIDFIVFGSSRANHNINPNKISKNSYNMGIDGRMIAFSATLIKLLPKQKKQLILLHIDPHNAFSNKYNGNDLDALFTKYNRNKTIKNEIDKLNQDNLFQNFYWSISYNSKVLGILKNYVKPKYNFKNYNGYDPIYPTKTQKNIFKKKLKNVKSLNCKKKFVLNDIYDMYLNELNLFCKNNNKTLIIFTSPILKDDCKDDNKYFNEIMESKGLVYYDLTDYFKNDNSLTYWKDETHLSNIGAELFTNSLKKILSSDL